MDKHPVLLKVNSLRVIHLWYQSSYLFGLTSLYSDINFSLKGFWPPPIPFNSFFAYPLPWKSGTINGQSISHCNNFSLHKTNCQQSAMAWILPGITSRMCKTYFPKIHGILCTFVIKAPTMSDIWLGRSNRRIPCQAWWSLLMTWRLLCSLKKTWIGNKK